MIEHRLLHLPDVHVTLRQCHRRRRTPDPLRALLHVVQLLRGAPPFVPLLPARVRRQPHREGLGEVLVGVLLGVPARDVHHVPSAKGVRLVGVDVGLAVVAELLAPLLGLVELVGVVEGVPRLVPQVHHDVPLVLGSRAQRIFDLKQVGIGQVKRNPDDRHTRGAPPLVRQVALRPERQTLGLELFVELADEPLQEGAGEVQLQVLDARLKQRSARRRQSVPKVGLGRLLSKCGAGEGSAHGSFGRWRQYPTTPTLRALNPFRPANT